jgi:tight adherence protein C
VTAALHASPGGMAVMLAALGALAGRVPLTIAALALGTAWALVVAVAASERARRRGRRLPASSGPASSPAVQPAPRPGIFAVAHGPGSPVVALGARIRRLADPGDRGVGPVGEAAAPDLSGRTAADRRTGWAALFSAGLLGIAPALAAAPILWAVATPILTQRRERARQEAQIVDQLPDVVDLLALTAAAGLPVAAALEAIGDRPGGPVGAALARAATHVRHGGTTAEALTFVALLGPAARTLADALAEHERYGTPLVPALGRVGIEARARRRRRAEEAARRLPVTLLFPLVLTTFPAFVLLTIVPLLAGSLGSLSLTSP